jgi:hypothetical protein
MTLTSRASRTRGGHRAEAGRVRLDHDRGLGVGINPIVTLEKQPLNIYDKNLV